MLSLSVGKQRLPVAMSESPRALLSRSEHSPTTHTNHRNHPLRRPPKRPHDLQRQSFGHAHVLIEAARPCRHSMGDWWFVDETYVRVAMLFDRTVLLLSPLAQRSRGGGDGHSG